VLDSLVLARASKYSLSEGLTMWQFPALAPSNTDSVNESFRSWEGLLTGSCQVLGGRQGDSRSREGGGGRVDCRPALNSSIGRP
jgi:hypothetical protein